MDFISDKDRMPVYISKKDVLYQKIVDWDEHIHTFLIGGANCQSDSLVVWAKLRKAGANRCVGTRKSDRATGDPLNKHYWVEVKDLVYDEHGGVRQIFNRTAYYKAMEIECEEKTDCGLLMNEAGGGWDSMDWEMKKKVSDALPLERWEEMAQRIRENNNK